MSNFLIFKAAFNNSATPAIGTYTAEGGTALFNRNTSLSPDYYLYNTAQNSAVQWFVPTAETTDFEFVADILTRNWSNNVTYFIIADSTGTTRLRMWSVNDNWHFENSDSITTSGTEYIGTIRPSTSGGFGVFHQFRVRVRKLTASSSSVEVYVDGTLKLTATAGAALVTCAKIGFVGGVNTFGPGMDAGIKNAYVYDLSGGDVIDRGVLSGAFNRFISWAKSIFATQDNVVLRSGGNLMTGDMLGRPNETGTFGISGGTTVGGNAGYIKCYGATESTYGGAVEIGGRDAKFIFRNRAIESWAGNQDLGTSGRRFGTAYIEALNINGTAAGDILTHNASEFVDVTGAQTIGGDKDFTGTTTAHDLVPSATDTYNFGSSSYQWNNAYIKSLTINGVACGDILTHNASEFVDVSSNQTIAGQKIFSHGQICVGRDIYHFATNPYGKNTPPTNTSYQYIWFGGNTASQGVTGSWYGGYLEQRIYPDGSAQGRWFIRDISENSVGLELFVNGSDRQLRPQANNTTDLGTSTNKWKSFNGINPGALSLWSNNYISLDTTGFDVTNTTIGTFTPTIDGWAILSISQKNKPFGIWLIGGAIRESFYSVKNNDDYFIFALIPVRANVNMTIYCTAADIDSTRNVSWLRLSPCQGNA